MGQRTLFDEAEPVVAPPIARRSDPQTSHDAAKKAEAIRTETVDRCFAILKDAGEPLTAEEIAFRAVNEYFPGLAKFTSEYVNAVGNHRKRAHELHNVFGLAEIIEGQRRNGSRLMKVKETK
jgi:hypothetical protein